MKEQPFDWRRLLTHQAPVVFQIPHTYKCVEEYIARFEDLNGLKRTTDYQYARGKNR